MPWQSHLAGGSHLGQSDPGTAAEAAPQPPVESPTGTPIQAQPASLLQINPKDIIVALVAAVATWLIITRAKRAHK